MKDPMMKALLIQRFGRASLALAKLISDGEELDTEDRNSIEAHLFIVHLAYNSWAQHSHPVLKAV